MVHVLNPAFVRYRCRCNAAALCQLSPCKAESSDSIRIKPEQKGTYRGEDRDTKRVPVRSHVDEFNDLLNRVDETDTQLEGDETGRKL